MSIDPRLQINKFELDNELVENPGLVQTVGDELAHAIAVRDTRKDELDTVKAELDTAIREEYKEKGLKATETMVEMAIQLDTDYQEALKRYSEAKLAANLAASLERAVSARADNLRTLSDLYKAAYFAINATKETPTTRENQYKLMRERLAAVRNQDRPAPSPRPV